MRGALFQIETHSFKIHNPGVCVCVLVCNTSRILGQLKRLRDSECVCVCVHACVHSLTTQSAFWVSLFSVRRELYGCTTTSLISSWLGKTE